MKLVINADDFGLTPGVTYGILDAMRRGVVTSTTMMVNTAAAGLAAELARNDPSLRVGLHINIALGRPLSDCPSLLRDGCFVKPAALGSDAGYDPKDLNREVEAQYQRFLELMGRQPTHIDSHLYAHQKLRKVGEAVRTLADRYRLPVRDCETDWGQAPKFIGSFKVLSGEGKPELRARLTALLPELEGEAELMVHPAFVDGLLLESSSYQIQRVWEHSVLTDPELPQLFENHKVQLVGFRDCTGK